MSFLNISYCIYIIRVFKLLKVLKKSTFSKLFERHSTVGISSFGVKQSSYYSLYVSFLKHCSGG